MSIFAGVKWWFSIGIALMAVMVGCQPPTASPRPSPVGEGVASRTLEDIDSLMWEKPDSALTLLMDFEGDLEGFNGHYCQLLIAELLYKNDYGQSNRKDLLKAVHYFDSIVGMDGADIRGKADTRGVSLPFLDARAHYINGVGFYEQGDLINSCTEYLTTLEVMESRFAPNELVGTKARFMALTYNRLGDLFS